MQYSLNKLAKALDYDIKAPKQMSPKLSKKENVDDDEPEAQSTTSGSVCNKSNSVSNSVSGNSYN